MSSGTSWDPRVGFVKLIKPNPCPIVTSSVSERVVTFKSANSAGQVQIDGTTLRLQDQKVLAVPVTPNDLKKPAANETR
jgi:hypothetical protein